MGPSASRTTTTPRAGSGAMFDGIAARYDLVNRVISLGTDQRWRRRASLALKLEPAQRVLDVATGTADLAIAIANTEHSVRVTGVDPSRRMLEIGERKVASAGLEPRVQLQYGHAEALPFEDNLFHGACIAFGIRNVPDRLAGLMEMARVTRPGGRVVVLELTEPPRGLLGAVARFHVHTCVPWLGGLLSGMPEYRYLHRSIAAFPPPSDFCELMCQAGIRAATATPLTFGACHLFVGEVAL